MEWPARSCPWAGHSDGCPTSLLMPSFDKCNSLKHLPLPFRDSNMHLQRWDGECCAEGILVTDRNFLQKQNDSRALCPIWRSYKTEKHSVKLSSTSGSQGRCYRLSLALPSPVSSSYPGWLPQAAERTGSEIPIQCRFLDSSDLGARCRNVHF